MRKYKHLSQDLQKRVIENYHKFYSKDPPAPSVSVSYARQLEDFCMNRNVTEDEVAQYYDWEAYANYCVPEDEEYVSAQEEESSE